jgi:hypothetical protein
MTINQRSRSTTSPRNNSPKRQNAKKDQEKKTASKTAARPKAKRRRPPRRATQEQIQMTFAAAKARDIINEYFIDCMEERNSSEHCKGLKFLAKYFRPRGVRVSREGHVTFPTGACTSVELERLIENSYFMLEEFLETMAKEVNLDLSDQFIDEFLTVGWRHGFVWSLTDSIPRQPFVPLILGLNTSSMTLELCRDGDREYVPDDGHLLPLERAFAAQLPSVWKQWRAAR